MSKTIAVVALVVVLALGVMFPRATTTVVERVSNLGASGQTHSNVEYFNGVVEGGVFTLSTTSSAVTLRDNDLKSAAVISISAAGTGVAQPALALTLPASTTWSSLDVNGQSQSWVIDDNHTAAATTTTITAGTGVDIDGTTANDDVINGGVSGRLTCWRLPSSDIRCIVEEMVDAG